ncbi:MAG: nicotinate-nucleotide--dimethylbenzimidazole phosphoribosyltransferase [Clostridia bacterium]|nr:nicotinate-nucleotide--dimethylbenzimidazole phosphoribosyltransferase [Clostridia bacterium]
MGAQEEARRRWDTIAKPLYALGRLEDLVVQIAGIQGTADVRIDRRCALVFCGDHGVVEEGVSQCGSDVTALVAGSIVEGTGNINLMAAPAGADVFAVDMGMQTEVPGTISYRQGCGTGNMTRGPAMTRSQAEQAVHDGMELVGDMKRRGYQIAVIGEMGIGNTTAASAVASVLLGLPVEDVTGRGAGLSDAGLLRKKDAIRRAIRVNAPDPEDPMDVLHKVGGFELAGMAGAYLGGYRYHMPVITDGMIPSVSALVAARLCPEAASAILPGHVSREPVDRMIMEHLHMEPVIDAGMALGEGTGGVMLLPLLDMALRVYHGTHTFEHLGMEAYTREGGST